MDFNEQPSYMDPFAVDHNPYNMTSVNEFYIYLFVGFVGLCLLLIAGYIQYKGKKNDNGVLLFPIGVIIIGFSFTNILSVKLSETNLFAVAFLMFIHSIACWMIVEGSTRYFILMNERRIKRQNDLAETRKINEIYEKLL